MRPRNIVRFFSASPSPNTVSYLTQLGIDSKVATGIAKKFTLKSISKADEVVDFLKGSSFTNENVSQLVRKLPQVLHYEVETNLKPKFQCLKPYKIKHLPEVLGEHPTILTRDPGVITAFLDITEEIFGRDDIVKMIREASQFDFLRGSDKIIGRLEVLKELGIQKEVSWTLLKKCPSAWVISKEKLSKHVDTVESYGLDKKKTKFAVAVCTLSGMSDSKFEEKVNNFLKLGWSREDFRTAFNAAPQCAAYGVGNVEAAMTYMNDVIGIPLETIARYSYSLGYRLEERIKPRLQVLKVLSSRGLRDISAALPALAKTDPDFKRLYVDRYMSHIPQLLDLFEGKVTMKSLLNESAGMQAIDEIDPTIPHALEDEQTPHAALDGLKQILSVKTTAVLPHILPKPVHLPLSAVNGHSLGAVAEVVSSVPKEVLPSYIKLVRDAVSTSRDKKRRKKKGGPVLIPGLCLPKALQSVLPIFLQGLTSGSAELREQAALGLGELIEVTSKKALKEFVNPITGPLIHIIAERLPWQVKSAILSTLSIMIQKGGNALKPSLPQLQTTFVECLQDNTRPVRSSAAFALGKLSALGTRIDPLVGDLLSAMQASDITIQESILTALDGVIKNAGKSLSSAVITRVNTQMKVMLYSEDDQIRKSAAGILGMLLQYLENTQVSELLMGVVDSASSSTWTTRHGSALSVLSMLIHNAAIVCDSPFFTSIIDCLKSSMKDEKFPVRESSVRALGRLLLHQFRTDPSNTTSHLATLNSLVLAMQDDSSEVRRRALSALEAVSKANPQAVIIHMSVYGSPVAECLKDASQPVRLAAEKCILHCFQLSKGTANVQAAQKYITSLDARRIAKLPEHSDDSEGSGDEASC